MISRCLIFVLFLLLLACGVSVSGQDAADTVGSLPGIEIKTAVDRAESYIGDLITYTLTITYDSTYELIPPPLGANLGAFDVKDYQPDIETELDDGRLKSQTIFMLSTYTTGDYVIPPLPVVFTLPDGTRKVMLAEPVPIKILSLLDMAGSDSVDIRPLKAQYEFPPDYTQYYLWGGGGLVLLALAAVVFGWWLWRRGRAQAAIDLRSAWEIAFEKLAFLKVEYLTGPISEQVRAKAYYVELTETTRAFLGRIYHTDMLEMTTQQFLDAFRETELPESLFDQLADFFSHADRVKFAKLMPESTRPEDDFLFAHGMVDSIRADYERRQEVEVRTLGQETDQPKVVEEQQV